MSSCAIAASRFFSRTGAFVTRDFWKGICGGLYISRYAIVRVYHLLHHCGKTAGFFLRTTIQGCEERLAEIPGTFERPQPPRKNAALGTHRFAGTVQRPGPVSRRDGNFDRLQISYVPLLIETVLLSAADLSAVRQTWAVYSSIKGEDSINSSFSFFAGEEGPAVIARGGKCDQPTEAT